MNTVNPSAPRTMRVNETWIPISRTTRGGDGVVGLYPAWLWLMLFVPTGIALGAIGLEFLERFLVSGDVTPGHMRDSV